MSCRVYGMLWNDARTGVGEYVRLAWKVLNARLSANQISEGIGRIGEGNRTTGLLIAREVADLIDAEGWEPKTIEDRENGILEWAATEWVD